LSCRRVFGLAILGAAVTAVGAAQAAPADPTNNQLRPDGQRLEATGLWDGALDFYLRLPPAERRRPEVRQHVQLCLRHIQQVARHRDAGYRTRVLTLPFPQAVTEYAQVLTKLRGYYVDHDKVAAQALFASGLQEFDLALADASFRSEYLAAVPADALAGFRGRLQRDWSGRPMKDVADAREAVREIARAGQRDLGLSPTVAVMEFACGACNALDEYSAYLPPGSPEELTPAGSDLFAAGLTLAFRGDGLYVERVLPGSYAASALCQPGDRVVRINRRPVEGMSPDAVAELIRNESGPSLDLELTAPGGVTSRVTQLPLDLPSIPPRDTQLFDTNVGYLRLLGFQKTTLQELDEAVLSMKARGMKALVIDLRGNPGGLFAVSVQVAERFLAEGVIVSTQGRIRTANQTYTAPAGSGAYDFPLVVLVDGETASAAEVLAGALKDRQRALLVGEPTYGKGSIQGMLQLNSVGGLRLTLAKFFPPGGQPFEDVGITPHVPEPVRDRQLELALDHAARLAAMRP
jgi:carboxyl-terminal processing protease